MNEVATDYNAGLHRRAGPPSQEFGGAPLANFPQPEAVVGNEIFLEAAINASGTNFTEIKALLNNQSGWPARMGDRLSFRYYFTLDRASRPSQITLTPTTTSARRPRARHCTPAAPTTSPSTARAPRSIRAASSTSARKCSSASPAPAPGTRPTTGRITGVATTPGSTPVLVQRIPVYDNGVRVFGNEPGGGAPDQQPPTVPANLRVTGTTSTTVSLAWVASTDDVSGVTGYQVFRGTTRWAARPASPSRTPDWRPTPRTRTRCVRWTPPAKVSAASAAVTATTQARHAGLHGGGIAGHSCRWRAAAPPATTLAITAPTSPAR